MLLLEPLWVYASVGLFVACGRRQFSEVADIWGNRYFSLILILIAGVFVPVENWVLHRHTDWETTFLLNKTTDSTFLALVSVVHVAAAVLSYWLSVYLLRSRGAKTVIQTTMWAFSLFFFAQGMFWDTLMYAGTYQEYHDGVPKTFVDFFYTDRFQDAYIIFFCIFGPPFYALAIWLNSGYTALEKVDFAKDLIREATSQGVIVCGGYLVVCGLGMLPANYGLERLAIIATMHIVQHGLVITPLLLSSTKEKEA